jgi:site-specific recombinase XerD
MYILDEKISDMKSEYTKVERSEKRTTYSLDWDTIVGLESRLLRDFIKERSITKGRDVLIVSVGVRLGLRVIDNLSLKWEDLMGLEVGEKFIRIEKKTNKERILVMSSKLREVLDKVIEILNPNPSHYIFSSQKGKGMEPMCVQTFNGYLKEIMKEYKIKYIGNCSSHLLRKTFVVGSIKKGFENGDHLSLVKVSRLIGHSNVSTTLRYTNFETNQMLNLYELE